MTLGGYNLTRYQAEVITFEAATRGVSLTGRALVERDSQIVKSDTVLYSGQTSGVQAIGMPSRSCVRRSMLQARATPLTAPIRYSKACRK